MDLLKIAMMKPEIKTFLIIIGYCSLLWLSNWSLNHEYDRETGLLSSGMDFRSLGALFGFIVSVVLVRRIWRVVRALLDARIRIPISIRLWGSWGYLLLLLPLMFGFTHHTTGTADDGATIQTVFQYGNGAAWASILFSAVAIMLFQFLIRLESFNPENRQITQSECCHPAKAGA